MGAATAVVANRTSFHPVSATGVHYQQITSSNRQTSIVCGGINQSLRVRRHQAKPTCAAASTKAYMCGGINQSLRWQQISPFLNQRCILHHLHPATRISPPATMGSLTCHLVLAVLLVGASLLATTSAAHDRLTTTAAVATSPRQRATTVSQQCPPFRPCRCRKGSIEVHDQFPNGCDRCHCIARRPKPSSPAHCNLTSYRMCKGYCKRVALAFKKRYVAVDGRSFRRPGISSLPGLFILATILTHRKEGLAANFLILLCRSKCKGKWTPASRGECGSCSCKCK